MPEPSQSISFQQVEHSRRAPTTGSAIRETPVALTVNGQLWTTFMCTPTHLEALMVGFLFNEGVLDARHQVADARACEHGDNVDVWLTHEARRPESWRRTSGCTGGVTAVETIARPHPVTAGREFQLPSERIGELVAHLFASQQLYRETGGVHTSALCDARGVVLAAEDIGRHNTLDKLAGLALLEDHWPEERLLVTTGRISSEMLQKAARMGVTVLVSRTSPSSLSIELAQAWGLTLIGYARRERFNLYTHPDRILTAQPGAP